MADLRMKVLQVRSEMNARAKSKHGEWLGRGATDDSLRSELELMRIAVDLLGEVFHELNDAKP